MDITIKTLKFDAGEKLLGFVEKKVTRLEKFITGKEDYVEVTLENLKEGKKARLKVHIPGETVIIERIADTFENAVTCVVDATKEKLTRAKEKLIEK